QRVHRKHTQNHIAHTHFKDKTINWKILHPASLGCYAHPCNMGRYIYRLWAISRCLYIGGILLTSGNSMSPQVLVWQYPDVFNSFSLCVCCYEDKRICLPVGWLGRDCHEKCRTFKSRMGSVVSVDSHLFLGAGYTSEYRLSYTAVCIYYYSCISSWFTYDLSSF